MALPGVRVRAMVALTPATATRARRNMYSPLIRRPRVARRSSDLSHTELGLTSPFGLFVRVVGLEDLVGRRGGRHLPREHGVADLGPHGGDVLIGAQTMVELVADERPGEVELLLRPLFLQAILAHELAMPDDALPDGVDAASFQRGAGEHRWHPVFGTCVHESKGAGEVLRARLGLSLTVAVGLVDGDDIGDLENPLLDALQLVAGA